LTIVEGAGTECSAHGFDINSGSNASSSDTSSSSVITFMGKPNKNFVHYEDICVEIMKGGGGGVSHLITTCVFGINTNIFEWR
jgi:hypothetical protein